MLKIGFLLQNCDPFGQLQLEDFTIDVTIQFFGSNYIGDCTDLLFFEFLDVFAEVLEFVLENTCHQDILFLNFLQKLVEFLLILLANEEVEHL